MIVHLTGSSRNTGDDLPFLRRIIKITQENGATLAHDWVEAANNAIEKLNIKNEDIDWKSIVDINLDAIRRSDVIIVEATSYALFQGYQIAVGLQHKKPILALSRNPIKGRSLSGIRNKLLTIKEYEDEGELEQIVAKFIQDNTITTKDLRFNFFIDRQIYNYLRSVAYETGKTKSEIIRELIEKEIRNKD